MATRRKRRSSPLGLSVARPVASGLGAQRPPCRKLTLFGDVQKLRGRRYPQSVSPFIGRCRAVREQSQGKIELCNGLLAHALKIGHGDADQANADRQRKHRPNQREADLAQCRLRRDRVVKCSAARRLPEVGIFDLHRNGVAKGLRLFTPRPDLVRHRLDARLDVGRINPIIGKGRLRAR